MQVSTKCCLCVAVGFPLFQLRSFRRIPKHGPERDRHEPGALPSSALPGAQLDPSLHAGWRQCPHQKVCSMAFTVTVFLPHSCCFESRVSSLHELHHLRSPHVGCCYDWEGNPPPPFSPHGLRVCIMPFETWWTNAGNVVLGLKGEVHPFLYMLFLWSKKVQEY